MMYRKIAKVREDDTQIYARVDADGVVRVTCTANNPDFIAWVAAGNTPEEPESL